MKHELYVLHAELNGTGYPFGYLFLENNGNSGNGTRTSIIIDFLRATRYHFEISPKFFLTDKDFAQISAIQAVWPCTKVQLCHWHIKRAIETKLKEKNTKEKRDLYEPIAANHKFRFIDVSFISTNKAINHSPIICPEHLRKHVWTIMHKHLNQHALIPNSEGQYLNKEGIRKQQVLEMYSFCKDHLLTRLWSYMWREWYNDDRWLLWARAAHHELSILKMTMFVEGHWKVLKRNFLYKFFRPTSITVLACGYSYFLTSRF